jgi:hypothetical protein
MIVRLVRISDFCSRLDPEILDWLLDEPVDNFSVLNNGAITSVRAQDRALRRTNLRYAMAFDRRTTRSSFARGRDVSATISNELDRASHDIGEEIRLEARDVLLLRPDRLLIGFSRARSYLGIQGPHWHNFDPGGPTARLTMASTHGAIDYGNRGQVRR